MRADRRGCETGFDVGDRGQTFRRCRLTGGPGRWCKLLRGRIEPAPDRGIKRQHLRLRQRLDPGQQSCEVFLRHGHLPA